jgi:hypothetical protein
MDGARFDALTKTLGTAHSRRTLTRLLAGLSLGGVLSALGSDEAAAALRIGGTGCSTGGQCKTGQCVGGRCSCSRKFPNCKQPTNPCKEATCNFSTKHCVVGPGSDDIDCGGGKTCCDGRCVNTQTNEAYCGSCDNGCTGNDACQRGTCFPRSICPANADICVAPNIECHKPDTTPCECVTSTEGNTFCAVQEAFCVTPPAPCQTSANCVSGEACVDISGCCSGDPLPPGTKTCMSPCPDPQ